MNDTANGQAPAQNGFQVRLTNFEGPFDLLLQLIFAHRLDVTEVALHQVTDDFIAYTRQIGAQLDLEETTAFLVVAATLLDLKAARLLPAGQVDDDEDLALLEVRDLLFARLLQYRAFKHVASIFAELEANALRSYPRSVALEEQFTSLLPEVMLGVDAESIRADRRCRLYPAPGAGGVHRASARAAGLGARAGQTTAGDPRGAGQRSVGHVFGAGRRLPGLDRGGGALPGAARTVSVPGGSIRAVRAAWRAPSFVDRGPSDQRGPGRSARPMMRAGDDAERSDEEERRTVTDELTDLDVDGGIPDIAEVAPLDPEELGSVLEALLLVVDTPVTVEALASAVEQPVYRVAAKLEVLAEELTARDSGIDLRKTSEGWRMYTRARFAPYVEKLLLDGARTKLTRAALETLAVVAYRQPVTRARVSAVRGVNVDAVIRTLVARGLITEAGTDDDSGAVTFATTELFLERLGLTSLAELPDIAPLLPDVDTIEDLSESLDSEPRFIKLAGGQARDESISFDVDQD